MVGMMRSERGGGFEIGIEPRKPFKFTNTTRPTNPTLPLLKLSEPRPWRQLLVGASTVLTILPRSIGIRNLPLHAPQT